LQHCDEVSQGNEIIFPGVSLVKVT